MVELVALQHIIRGVCRVERVKPFTEWGVSRSKLGPTLHSLCSIIWQESLVFPFEYKSLWRLQFYSGYLELAICNTPYIQVNSGDCGVDTSNRVLTSSHLSFSTDDDTRKAYWYMTLYA